MSQTEDLLIIYEMEAKQWVTYLRSVVTGPIPEEGICCYDISTVSSQRDDFLWLSRYKCKLLILTKGMLEGLCQLRRFFLSRVLSPASCVVVLLCGVDSLTPLLDLVPLDGEECLQLSSEQDASDYMASVMEVVRKGASPTAANVNSLTRKPSGSKQKAKQMLSSRADGVRSSVVVIPSRVPCGSCVEVFVLLKNEAADCDCEVEFSGQNQKVRVKPDRWNERILCVSAPDFPAGNVRVTVYSGGKPLSTSQLQYYTSIEELTCLLSNAADPVEFMCQALKVSSAVKLDQKLSSMLLQGMPTGGFQGLKSESTHERELHREDVPSLLHFAARYGFRSFSSLLLQSPGAGQALCTANRHGHTPSEVAKRHGHAELHVMLKESLNDNKPSKNQILIPDHDSTKCNGQRMFNSSGDNGDGSVYEMMCNAGVNKQQQGEDEEEEDDLYTMLGEDDDSDSVVSPKEAVAITNRPPAPTPRPERMKVKESNTSYIAQVFQKKKKKTPRGSRDVSSLIAHQQESSSTGTYDTFVVNQMKGLESLVELQPKVKMDEVADGSVDWEHIPKILIGVQTLWRPIVCLQEQKEKRSDPRASVMDSSIYDKINNVRQTPSVRASENRRGNQLEAEFYSKPMRGQQVPRRANKQ